MVSVGKIALSRLKKGLLESPKALNFLIPNAMELVDSIILEPLFKWRMEKTKLSEKVTNEQILERIQEKKRTFLNNILRRKANCIGYILRRNCLLHDSIE